VQRWRYHSVLVRDLSIAESKLNVEGEKGWELVSVCLIDANSARCFFKMPAEETEPPAFVSAPETALVGNAPFA
jgi:hypothetical protein